MVATFAYICCGILCLYISGCLCDTLTFLDESLCVHLLETNLLRKLTLRVSLNRDLNLGGIEQL